MLQEIRSAVTFYQLGVGIANGGTWCERDSCQLDTTMKPVLEASFAIVNQTNWILRDRLNLGKLRNGSVFASREISQ